MFFGPIHLTCYIHQQGDDGGFFFERSEDLPDCSESSIIDALAFYQGRNFWSTAEPFVGFDLDL